jgi:hypothetical protein
MNSEDGVVVQILRDLAANEARWYSEADVNSELRPIYAYLESRFPKYEESVIQAFIDANPDGGSLDAWGGYVRLRPCRTKAWAVPVLMVEYRFKEPRKLGLRLGLFLQEVGADAVASIGYRFETPDADGENAYFHLQHILELGNGSGALPTPGWIPESKLAVPLDVRSEVGLMLCLLASIYGWASEEMGQVLNAQYKGMLSTHLQNLQWAPDH